MTWEGKLAGCFIAGAFALGVAESCRGGEATLQSARPWTLGQCDRLVGRPARAVFNRTIYSHGGWPLWLVVCVFP